MPLVYQHIINENTKLAVWNMEEKESFFAEKIGFVTGINHPQKRLQFMAGRYLLKLLAPGLDVLSLTLNTSGKPIDPSGKIKFSISHSGNKVAVMVSEDFNVGIDIQFPEEKLLSLKNKFLSENDMLVLSALNQPETIQLCLGWSVKETLFKWYGNGGVDFKRQLHILSASFLENGFLFECLISKNYQKTCLVNAFLFDEFILASTFHN